MKSPAPPPAHFLDAPAPPKADTPVPPAPPKPTQEEIALAHRIKVLALRPGEFGCSMCGFKVRHSSKSSPEAAVLTHGGGTSEAGEAAPADMGVRHRCDPSDLIKWTRKTAPPRAIGTPRAMIALRRSLTGENFDLVFVPAVEVSGMKVLAEDESLEYAMQKVIDVIPDELPLDGQR